MIEEKNLKEWAKEYCKKHNEKLNKIRKENNLKVKDVIAMSEQSDPFWMTPAKVMKAKWLEKIVEEVIKPYLERIGVSDSHLRDYHYVLASGNYKTWNNEKYLNSDKCWSDLGEAFSVARYLEFVDYRLIRDKKNVFNSRVYYDVDDDFMDFVGKVKDSVSKNSVIEKIFVKPFSNMLNVSNYQKVHVELWAEKDLALLEKISERYNVNSVIGEGETSVTMVYDLVDRIEDSQTKSRSIRVGYVSDCDVVGTNMVKAMSRKLEHELRKRDLDVDVKIFHLMITPEQVSELGLPPIPMKDSVSKAYETRKRNWMEGRKMSGGVEVNSLHALHPKIFEKILVDFIESYFDVDTWNSVLNFNRELIDKIRFLVREGLKDFDVLSFIEMIENVDWENIESEFNDKVEEFEEVNFDYRLKDGKYKWLLDSELKYLEQLVIYKKFDSGDL